MIFILNKFTTFRKIGNKKIWVNQIFLICYYYTKNNSYTNLGDESHIRTVWSCSNAVKTHNVNIFHKILATGRPFAKNLIKYNRNSLEENDEEENEPIDLEFAE